MCDQGSTSMFGLLSVTVRVNGHELYLQLWIQTVDAERIFGVMPVAQFCLRIDRVPTDR